jgi:hypothetical protein
MKIRNKSAVILVALVLAFGTLVGNAIAKSLNVETLNKTNNSWNATECISGCVAFTLHAAPVFKQIPEPSSGTATLAAYFVDVSTNAPPVMCHQSYNVLTSSLATVSVLSSSQTAHCTINIQ